MLIGQHDVFGYANAAVTLSTLNINAGGTLDKLASTGVNETLTGVAVTMTGGLWAGTGGYYDLFTNGYGDDTIHTVANSVTATISASLNFRSANNVFTVDQGTTPSGTDLLVSGILTGTGFGFTKEGTGKMVLTGANTYVGPTTINNGILQIGDGTTSGSLANTPITNSASLVLNPGVVNSNIVGAISGPGTVTKIGPNTATLGGVNSYTGDTNINAGTLRLKPTTTSTAATVNVADGARLAVSSFDLATTVVNISTLNLGATTGGGLNFELLGPTTLSPLAVTTAFTTTGTNSINVSTTTALPVGQFPLIAYPGTISGAGFSGLTLGTLPLRVIATLVNNTANSTVDLNVAGTDTIRWNGTVNGTWDINTTQNWKTVITNVDTNYLQPTAPGDIVAFNDLAVGNFTINIPATVTPSAVNVNNSTNNYTFTGADIAGSFTLFKNGTGTVTFGNNNTYTGGTVINGGTVVLGTGGVTGAIVGAVTINGGTLAFNRSDDQTLATAITIGGNTTINQLGTGAVTLSTNLNIDVNNLALGGSGTMTLSGVISGTGAVTKQDSGTLNLTNINSTFSGNLTVAGGTLISSPTTNTTANVNSSLGVKDPSRTITINTGANLIFATNDVLGGGGTTASAIPTFVVSGTLTTTKFNAIGNVTLNGGTLANASTDGGAPNYQGFQFLGPITVIGTSASTISSTNANAADVGNHMLPGGTEFIVSDVFGNGAPSLIVSSPLVDGSGNNAGPAGLIKSGLGTMLLTAANTYTGDTTINDGVLQLGDGVNTGSITGFVSNNGTLAINPGPAGQTFAAVVSGGGNFVKSGPNTLTLTGANTYSGTTSVNGGTLRVQPNSLPGGTSITVADGATLGVFNVAANQILATSLNLGVTTGGKLSFELSGNTTLAPLFAATFTTAGTNAINVSTNTLFTVGQFPLVQYSGSIGGAGFPGLTLGTLPLRVIANLVDNSANSSVDLNVTAIDIPRWTGSVNATWDINSTPNWQTVTTNTTTTYLQPTVPGDDVLFNDQAVGNFSVNIPAVVSPSSVTLNNSTHDYTFSGAAIAGPGDLNKNGTGTLTLVNDNTYTGGTVINAGTLVLGNGGTTGSVAGPVVTNASLAFNRSDAQTINYLISGTGTVTMQGTGSVQLTNLGNSFSGNLIVASGTVLAANALNPSASATSSMGAQTTSRSIIVNAGATLSFPSNNAFCGGGSAAGNLPLLFISGTVTSTRYNALPSLTLNGGLLTQSATDSGGYEGYQFLGGVTVIGTSASYITTGNGKANHLFPGGTEFNVADVYGDGSPSLIVSTPLRDGSGDYPGAGNLSKTGPGNMLLTAASSFTGTATITTGTLTLTGSFAAASTVAVGDTGKLAGSGTAGNATLTGGGIINFSTTGSLAGTLGVDGGFWNGQGSVAGAVTVNSGAFTIGSGARLTAPAGVTVTAGTLAGTGTINGSVTYSSSSNSTFAGGIVGAGTLTVNGTGELALTGFNTYTGVTTITSGTLTVQNSLSGPGGAISIADGAVLQAAGVLQRDLTVNGASQTGMVKAVGNLTLANFSGGITFDGHLNTQGNFVQFATAGDALVRSISMSNGATLSSGTSVKLANNQGGFNQGDTGVVFINGTTTIGGTFWAGRVTGDSGLFVGAGVAPSDNVTFTGILRGVLNNFGVNVTITGLDKEGWSPTFSVTSGADFAAGTTNVVVNTTTPYTPIPNTWMPQAPAAATRSGLWRATFWAA